MGTEHLKGCPVPYLFLVLYLTEVFAVKDGGFMNWKTLVCHMDWPASFFLACTNFSLGRAACRNWLMLCAVLSWLALIKMLKKKCSVLNLGNFLQ